MDSGIRKFDKTLPYAPSAEMLEDVVKTAPSVLQAEIHFWKCGIFPYNYNDKEKMEEYLQACRLKGASPSSARIIGAGENLDIVHSQSRFAGECMHALAKGYGPHEIRVELRDRVAFEKFKQEGMLDDMAMNRYSIGRGELWFSVSKESVYHNETIDHMGGGVRFGEQDKSIFSGLKLKFSGNKKLDVEYLKWFDALAKEFEPR